MSPSALNRPVIVRAKDVPRSWGWELWLTSEELDALISLHPEALGTWTRRIFGDAAPVFGKLIHTDFPPRVHMGFRERADRGQVLAWLEREQELVRQLFAALRVKDAAGFEAFHGRYSAWAGAQALLGWAKDDDREAAAALGGFVDPAFAMEPWLRAVRENRAAIVATLNDVDLRAETGNLLLTSAGILHAIFGLSHQTHPLDRSRKPLEALYAALGELHARGEADHALLHAIGAADLPAMRGKNAAPPKNEAWFPTTALGAEVLVEPQQTSDTTYSLADFYTPLTWEKDRVRFRKGDATSGLSREALAKYLADVDLEATSIDAIRRRPTPVGEGRSRLVDEPTTWPFFTLYQLDVKGRFTGAPAPGVFEQLFVTRGAVTLSDDQGVVGELSPRAPAFVPATMPGKYTLASDDATVLVMSVPSPRSAR